MLAVNNYERAAQCGRGNLTYAAAAHDTMQRYREIMADTDSTHWVALTSIEDRQRRIDAVVAHAIFHGERCQHRVAAEAEYRAYVAEAASSSTPEIRRRLLAMATTPLAGELFRIYAARRIDEYPHSADGELEVLDQLRLELHGTPYARIAESLLVERTVGNDDPFKVDRVCRALGPGADREACHRRAQELWTEAIVGAPVRQLVDICPRIDSPKTRAHCENALAEEGLKLVTERADPETLALADVALRKASAPYQMEWRIRLLRRDAEENFNRILNHDSELGLELTDSVGAWNEFIKVFDTLSRQVSNSRQESLRSIHPELVRRIDRQREKVVRQADDLYRRVVNKCRGEEKKLRKREVGVKAGVIQQCITDLATVLSMNGGHPHARNVLTDLQDAATLLTLDRKTEWTPVIVPLLLTEALRRFISPTFARLVFYTFRTVRF